MDRFAASALVVLCAVLASFPASCDASAACDTAMSWYFNNTDPQRIGIMKASTGQTLNDFGEYGMCQSDALGGGQYCTAQWNLGPANASASSFLGVCAPHGCTAQELVPYLWRIAPAYAVASVLDPYVAQTLTLYCQDDRPAITSFSGAVAMIVILSIFGGVVVLSSIYDWIESHDCYSAWHQERIRLHMARRGTSSHGGVTRGVEDSPQLGYHSSSAAAPVHVKGDGFGTPNDTASLASTQPGAATIDIHPPDGEHKVPSHAPHASPTGPLPSSLGADAPLLSLASAGSMDSPGPVSRKPHASHHVRRPSASMIPPSVSETSPITEFARCFSLNRNFAKLIQQPPTPTNASASTLNLNSLNAIRVCSMAWIILCHTVFFTQSTTENFYYMELDVSTRWTFSIIIQGVVAVDTFFWLSGLLATYLVMNEIDAARTRKEKLERKRQRAAAAAAATTAVGDSSAPSGSIHSDPSDAAAEAGAWGCTDLGISWPMYYAHRFIRLSPIYYMWIMIYWHLSTHVGSGPLWYLYETADDPTNCGEYWWANLLYVNNFVPYTFGDECFGWAWYLANDMQFAIILPLFIWVYCRDKTSGWILCAGTLIASVISTGIVLKHVDASASWFGNTDADYDNLFYSKPWSRITPYIIGIMTAFFLHSHTVQYIERLTFRTRMIMTAFAAFCFLGVIYGPAQVNSNLQAPDNWSQATHIFYLMFAKIGWSIGLSILLILLVCGYCPSVLREVLHAQFWTPLARLTYQAYLCHPIFITNINYSRTRLFTYSDVNLAGAFFVNLVGSYLCAFVGFLCIEKPVMNLEAVCCRRPARGVDRTGSSHVHVTGGPHPSHRHK